MQTDLTYLSDFSFYVCASGDVVLQSYFWDYKDPSALKLLRYNSYSFYSIMPHGLYSCASFTLFCFNVFVFHVVLWQFVSVPRLSEQLSHVLLWLFYVCEVRGRQPEK